MVTVFWQTLLEIEKRDKKLGEREEGRTQRDNVKRRNGESAVLSAKLFISKRQGERTPCDEGCQKGGYTRERNRKKSKIKRGRITAYLQP